MVIIVPDGSVLSMKKKVNGGTEGEDEVGKGTCPRHQTEQVHVESRIVGDLGAQSATGTSTQSSNGQGRPANGCGQRSTGSVHAANGSRHSTNGSYANPLNASTLPNQTSASNSMPTPLLLPTYPWDNESDDER